MGNAEAVQAIRDEEHLRLLSIFYFISAGLSGFIALLPLLYAAIGLILVSSPPSMQHGVYNPPPAAIGWILFAFGAGFSIMFLVMAILKLLAGLSLRKRRHRVFCLVVAGLTCLGIPYGTVLGIFSFIVLGRASVSALFAASKAD